MKSWKRRINRPIDYSPDFSPNYDLTTKDNNQPPMTDAQERRNKRREVLVYALGVVAVVLIWRGVWDLSAALISPWTSLLIGLALVGIIAYVRKDIVARLF